ncbi:MAG TPA: hypothetical protein PKD72_10650, partial [Gemmatales bacterium]|nr:hypothetical protein [Gemmatales bacterium]
RRIKTIAFIPENCTGTANFLPLACDEIVMGEEARLGDMTSLVYEAENKPFDANLIKERQESLLNITNKSGIPEAIVQGLFQRDLELVLAQEEADPNKR